MVIGHRVAPVTKDLNNTLYSEGSEAACSGIVSHEVQKNQQKKSKKATLKNAISHSL
jgi:hypothetical protein